MGRIKRLAKILLGREPLIRREVSIPRRRFGSDYGGWTIAPQFLNQQSTVYSLGIGEDISFDLALIGEFGVQVVAFDPTPGSIEWLRKQATPGQFMAEQVAITGRDGVVDLFPLKEIRDPSHSVSRVQGDTSRGTTVRCERLLTAMRRLGHLKLDLLKMDIEGAEYDVIEDVRTSNPFIGQIVVEFHHWFEGYSMRQTRESLRTLRELGFRVFNITHRSEVSLIHQSLLDSGLRLDR